MDGGKSIEEVKTIIRGLEDELAKDPRHRMLAAWKELEEKLVAIQRQLDGPPKKNNVGGIPRRRPRGSQPRGKVAQHEAAQRAVAEAGEPLTTAELIDRIPLSGGDIKPGEFAARNLTSVLSARSNLRSIRWRGGRAWWPKNKEVPPE